MLNYAEIYPVKFSLLHRLLLSYFLSNFLNNSKNHLFIAAVPRFYPMNFNTIRPKPFGMSFIYTLWSFEFSVDR